MKGLIDNIGTGSIAAFSQYAVFESVSALPATGVSTTGYIVGNHIYAYVGTGGDTRDGKYQDLGALEAAGVSVTTAEDGTFTIHAGGNDYTVNLNHTHPNMCKLVVCEESGLPSTLDMDTIYAQVNDAAHPTEIEVLYIAGLEFTGGGVAPGTPNITSPSGSPINLGSNEGSGVTSSVWVKGNAYITGDLTVTVPTNSNLSLTYGQQTGTQVTIAKNDAINGVTVDVAYSGSGALELADGLTVSGGGATAKSATLIVTAVVLPTGFTNNKAWQDGNGASLVDATGYCISPQYSGVDSHSLEICFGFQRSSDTSAPKYGCAAHPGANFIQSSHANTCYTAPTTGVTRTITSVAGGYISCTFLKAEIENCYIKDNTTGSYIWKGNNVT